MQSFYLPCILVLPSISAWICILQENESISSQVLNIFDIETNDAGSQANSTCCRIRLSNYSASHLTDQSLCFIEQTVTNKPRTTFKVSGKFYPWSKEETVLPVNAVCMRGEIMSCIELDGQSKVNQKDSETFKSAKHRRKTLLDGYDEEIEQNISESNSKSYNDDPGFKDVIMVAPSRPKFSSEGDIQVEYELGEELKLACLLEAKSAQEIVWMKDNQFIPSSHANDIDFQIVRNPINNYVLMDILKISINSNNASGLYTCYLKSGEDIQGLSMSFQVIAISSKDYAEYRFKKPNVTGFIIGMLPSIILFFYIIMSLGYRSRYATDQEEEEEGLGI